MSMDQQSGGEVRRIHVIYFLSRKGRIEQPHMIRVHHISRNGVHLRDVKRWISDLRGKDMAESFAWSYKRTYKSGYVWQDLLDEDLITPISDNEYVIKGSEILSTSTDDTDNNGDDKSSSKMKNKENQQDQSMKESTQKLTEIEEDSSPCTLETSTTTEEPTKNEEQEEQTSKEENNSIHSTLLNRNKKVVGDIDNNNYKNAITSKSRVKKNGKSYTSGASNVLRNIITCGAVDTNESGMVKIDRRNKISLKTYTSKIIASIKPEIRKEEARGGSERILGSYSSLKQVQSGRKSWDGVRISRKTNNGSKAGFKPDNVPNCSHCGKSFKPEKLHQHMKSCRGLRAFTTKSPIPTSNILVNH